MAVLLTRASSIVPDRPGDFLAQPEGYVVVPPVAAEWHPVARAIRGAGEIADLISAEPADGGTLLRVRFRPGVTPAQRLAFVLPDILAGVLPGWGIRAVWYVLGPDDAAALVWPPA